jgi:glyoxylate reductase
VAYTILTNAQLPDYILAMVAEVGDLHIWSGPTTPPELLQRVEAFIVYGHPIIDGAVMDTMPNLRVISNHGVGVDHINLADAHARGIPVGNTPNLLDGATADMTFALLMAIARNVVIGDHFARSAEFTHFDPSVLHGAEVHNATIGIIGMGNIGRQVARRARGFDMRILYHNRRRNLAAEEELGVEYRTLDDLLQESDYVTLNCPLTPETRNLISYAQLQRMQPTAFLVNVARGGVVDTEALQVALQEKWIAGAALDVTEPEPLPRDHPMLRLQNVIIAPHLGSATRQTRHNMARRAVDNMLAGLEGRALLSPVVSPAG